MNGDEKIILIRDRVNEAERLIRRAMDLMPFDHRQERACAKLTRAVDSLHRLDVLMQPRESHWSPR
jgi:hypothetical protein